jgi:dTDP-4-dehydrorhamnose 3,5-epimerase
VKVTETELPAVLVIEPDAFGDSRGWFLETWSQQRYAEAGTNGNFLQDNVSFSQKGVLRGLHFQNPKAQDKLVQVLSGEVFDVAVDIRVGSPTFGQWVGQRLSAENHKQMYIPAGFAHGFCVLSDSAIFSYKCSDYYSSSAEMGIIWNDPDIGIGWPVDEPTLSKKDTLLPRLKDIAVEKLPRYEARR